MLSKFVNAEAGVKLVILAKFNIIFYYLRNMIELFVILLMFIFLKNILTQLTSKARRTPAWRIKKINYVVSLPGKIFKKT